MNEFKEVTDTIQVPRNTGIEGFLHTVKTLLRLPKVTDIHIDSRGTITCKRYAKEGDSTHNAGVDFEALTPSSIVRNTHVDEVTAPSNANAAVLIGSLFDMVSVAQLKPLAFLTGADSALWEWYRTTTHSSLNSRDTLHGLPLHTDRKIPDTALILAAGYGRDAALVDARNSFKLEMPVFSYPEPIIEVLI